MGKVRYYLDIAKDFGIRCSNTLTGNFLNLPYYLLNVRINKAKYYLNATGKSIKNIAYDVGFANEETFFRAFKRVVGIKPYQYKKQCTKMNPTDYLNQI